MSNPTRQGGARPYFNDAVAGTKQEVSQGQNTVLYSLHLMNGTAATAYLQIFFKKAADVTVGTTVADFTIAIPTNAATDFVQELAFPAGVGVAGSTGLTLAGTTTATGSTGAAISVSATYA